MVNLNNHLGLSQKSRHDSSTTVSCVPTKYTPVLPNNVIQCGCSSSHKKSKNTKLTGKVSYVPDAEYNKLNPYLKSVCGKSYLNLGAFNNTIKVYYGTSAELDTINLNKALSSGIPPYDPTTSLDWNEGNKGLMLAALLLHANFLNVTISFVETYDEADFIAYLAANLSAGLGSITLGSSSIPSQIDTDPNLNGKLYVVFNNTVFSSFPNEIGNIYFWTMIHEVAHTYGLGHPHDTLNDTVIMPGCTSLAGTEFSNQGLFDANNLLMTIMSYVYTSQYYFTDPATGVTEYLTNQPRTLMPLDLQSYRFLYKVSNNQKYVDNWIDLKCSSNIVQTIVSTNNGVTLDLTTFESPDFTYNLNMTKFIANPIQDNANTYSNISSSSLSYIGAPCLTNPGKKPSYRASLLDCNSYIKTVAVGYPLFNLFAGTIPNHITLNANENSRLINVYLKCRAKNYTVTKTPTLTTIQNKINKCIITVNNLETSEVFIYYGLNN